MALSVLRALNIFEQDILSREHVTSGKGPVLLRMSQVYHFSRCEDVMQMVSDMLIHNVQYTCVHIRVDTKEKTVSKSSINGIKSSFWSTKYTCILGLPLAHLGKALSL